MRKTKKDARPTIESDSSRSRRRHCFFIIADLPSEFNDWKTLKDCLRRYMKRDKDPVWTEVFPKARTGFFAVLSPTDAKSISFAFNEKYSSSFVHYFCSEGDACPTVLDLQSCNCKTHFDVDGHSQVRTAGLMDQVAQGWEMYKSSVPRNFRMAKSSSEHISAYPGPSNLATMSSPESVYSQISLEQQMAHMNISEQPEYPAPYTYGVAPVPAYTTSSTSHLATYTAYAEPALSWPGLVSAPETTESLETVYLSIILTNLSYKMQKADLRQILTSCGFPAGSYLKLSFPTADDESSTGTAKIQFFSQADAEQAIRQLEGKEWQGRTLKVRWDKAKTPIQASSPPVANGSTI